MKSIKFLIKFILCLVLLGIPMVGGYLAFGPNGLLQPVQIQQSTIFHLSKGDNVFKIANALKKDGILKQSEVFLLAALVWGHRGLQAGYYQIDPKDTPWHIIQKFLSGEIAKFNITFPEGWTVHMILEKIRSEAKMSGLLMNLPKEGSLLPGTYQYTFNQPRQTLVKIMQAKMQEKFLEMWSKRDPNLKIKMHDALVLASIVEKETSSEHSDVAQVYLNRLVRGMKLQADPTVIYGITNGRPLGRKLIHADLAIDSPYNTYRYQGLPPTPIACPGEKSIAGVLHPKANEYLFFVANGTGGHSFAKNLAQHNRNVTRWRLIEKAS